MHLVAIYIPFKHELIHILERYILITNFSDIKNPSNLYWSQECSEKVRLGLKIAELAKGASEKKNQICRFVQDVL